MNKFENRLFEILTLDPKDIHKTSVYASCMYANRSYGYNKGIDYFCTANPYDFYPVESNGEYNSFKGIMCGTLTDTLKTKYVVEIPHLRKNTYTKAFVSLSYLSPYITNAGLMITLTGRINQQNNVLEIYANIAKNLDISYEPIPNDIDANISIDFLLI